ncbi:MAG TPA: tetratricopeptide repeat protein [Syntrophorhabdaceae bacterium]|nr:tetratricopeptide repeat protein [Syntrophorhabdaceae bacterium]
MGKNRLLVSSYRTVFLIAVMLCASCSLPRIIVLHDPLTAEEHINLGVTYENKKEYDEALKEYEAALKRMPVAYLYMGNIYFQKGSVADAERCYEKAIQKTGDPRAYNNLAWLYYVKRIKLDEAENLARRAVELSPDAQDYKDTLDKIIEEKGKSIL